MSSRTCIPEFIAGTIALGFCLWMGPLIFTLNQSVILLYSGNTDVGSQSIILSSAFGVFIVCMALLFGGYCYALCIERAAFYLYEKRSVRDEKKHI